MLLPVIRVDRGIGNRGTAMNHHATAYINAHMGYARGVIGALEENQVTGLCIFETFPKPPDQTAPSVPSLEKTFFMGPYHGLLQAKYYCNNDL